MSGTCTVTLLLGVANASYDYNANTHYLYGFIAGEVARNSTDDFRLSGIYFDPLNGYPKIGNLSSVT